MGSGIYQIKNILNERIYVGSAKDFEKRIERHFKSLDENTHHNIFLQRDYNKCGREAFIWSIIEEIEYEKKIILEREQYNINLIPTELKYNLSGASFGDCLTNHPNREDIITKRSKTIKEVNSNLSKSERSEVYGRIGVKNGMYGKEHTKEAKKENVRCEYW